MSDMKKTKIVATIGPATESEEMLTKLVNAGMDMMRLNFSHGDFAEHGDRVENLKKTTEKTGRHIAIMQDLSGPKIRIGEFATERVELIPSEEFILTQEKIIGDKNRAYINYKNLATELKVGSPVLLDDGKKKLEVTKIVGTDVHCKIIIGGDTKGRRGVNLPGAYLSIGALTDKDKSDMAFGIKHQVNYVALSFVRRASDVIELRELLKAGGSDAAIIVKIETPEAVENFDEILSLTDGVMVARGDLAIEIPAETVPMIQKMIIKKCNDVGKPVITATQMLESMINSPVPTRAEVSDIANAILDGTDAVMLSEETTLGKYPIEAVEVMARVARQIEADYPERTPLGKRGKADTAEAVAGAVVRAADEVGAKVIFALTESGSTARMIARFRPRQNIIAMTPNDRTAHKLALNFGCVPFIVERYDTLKDAVIIIREYCLKQEMIKKGDKVVITAGTPFNTKNTPTNMLMVETI